MFHRNTFIEEMHYFRHSPFMGVCSLQHWRPSRGPSMFSNSSFLLSPEVCRAFAPLRGVPPLNGVPRSGLLQPFLCLPCTDQCVQCFLVLRQLGLDRTLAYPWARRHTVAVNRRSVVAPVMQDTQGIHHRTELTQVDGGPIVDVRPVYDRSLFEVEQLPLNTPMKVSVPTDRSRLGHARCVRHDTSDRTRVLE